MSNYKPENVNIDTLEKLFQLLEKRKRFEDIVLAFDQYLKINLMKYPKIKDAYNNLK